MKRHILITAGLVLAIGTVACKGSSTTSPPAAKTSTASTAANQDLDAEGTLRNALAAAKVIFTDHDTYVGVTPKTMYQVEPSINFDAAGTASVGPVSIRAVTPTTVLLVTGSASGSVFCIADDTVAAATTYGTTDAQTVADCSDPSWPTLHRSSSNALPSSYPSPSASLSPDNAAQADLLNAMATALTYGADHKSFSGLTPAAMTTINPSETFNASPTAVVGEVSVRGITTHSVVLVEKSESGTVFCIARIGSNQTYGTADAKSASACK